MHHGPDPVLATFVACILLAFLFGAAARALKLPAIIGYIVAGIVVGPYTPGFVAEHGVVSAMAELGVALLLFSVGLHFRPADLLAVRHVAVPGALGQIALASGLGAVVGVLALGLGLGAALAFGLAMAISSTAVATRALEERGRLGSEAGRIALGWLVMQDLVVVFALVMLPAVAGVQQDEDGSLGYELGKAAVSLAAFLGVMWVFGRRALPWLLVRVARGGSRELFTLAVLAMALGVAFLASTLFGVSFALGAFFAGVVLGESDLGHQAAAEAMPMQRIFAAIFFVSVGMLLDPAAAMAQPLAAAASVLVVLLAVAGGTFGLLLLLRVHPRTAATVAGSLGQIGEFSFLLTEVAVRREILPDAVRGPVLVAAVATILLTPLLLRLAEAAAPRLERSARLALWRGERRPRRSLTATAPMAGHAVVVGTGRVGALVIRALREHGLPVVAVEENRQAAERLVAEGTAAVWGDATRPEVLSAAALDRARLLVIALPGAVEARAVLALARAANPAIHAILRTHSDEEAVLMEAEEGVGLVMMGEREVALGMADYAMLHLGVAPGAAQATVEALRGRRTG
ncbi:cation:proton antiporter [Roseomonas sp. AR75]|uniref:cation:proton antiporter n=1 Tax=Roseomonas sp. AR75 TaxID=2562311 RepID=UPI0014855A16|nr:cation:proton antiporter [Roseomonas sp. AR75]